ncbi:uncharacterized protein C8orf76-like [Gigantopelta aegis]|uniref:uncharacterized protein C8orf76-like n=1 Tax=Gigantopelta aegis TaxID=1735272 RepID=UPI001B889E7D|nr:uncharacterized protein C8orf76-like [Gigantopelta aegis]XP_041358948.1 uncharacterized protein C8orf76-like [Gigantopelta aegis]
MELGLEFDDDDLICDVISSKAREPLGSYHVKVCTPLWFDQCQNGQRHIKSTPGEILEELLAFKFSGDYHYHQKEYQLAANKYKEAFDLLQPNVSAVRLDISQSLAKCYLYTGQTEEAIQIVNSLIRTAQNVDQQRQCLILQHKLCVFSIDWLGAVCALQKLITMECLYAQYWLQLAEAYRNCPVDGNIEDINIKLATCYIRARLLLRSVYHQCGPFVQERNNRLVAEITQNISNLPITESELKRATEFLSRDIRSDLENDLDDDQQDTENIKVMSTEGESFGTRWFQWSSSVSESFQENVDSCGKVT